MKVKAIALIVATQLVFFASPVFADDGNELGRPHISDVGGDDHSPGVTFVIFITLLLIGFGIGLTVGRRTRRK